MQIFFDMSDKRAKRERDGKALMRIYAQLQFDGAKKLTRIHTKRHGLRHGLHFASICLPFLRATRPEGIRPGESERRFHAYRSSSLYILFRRVSSIPFYPSRLSRRSKHEFHRSDKIDSPDNGQQVSIFRDERVVVMSSLRIIVLSSRRRSGPPVIKAD